MAGRRLIVLLVVLAAIGIPAAVLQVLCVGTSCPSGPTEAVVPFCPLPDALKAALASGFREGRSPDVLAVGAGTPVYSQIGGLRLPWPSTGSPADARVPVVFAGRGISRGTEVPDGSTLDRIAPTVAEALGLDRPFPEVRSGTAIDGVASGEVPRLVLMVAWKGVGSAELEQRPRDWPFLASLLDEGAGSLGAEPGSLPLDPAAVLTTIGTGGLPAQHGITGSFLRNDEGRVVGAFGEGSPVQIVASLADDLEEDDRRTLVGLVATEQADRGIVGGGWYQGQDPVDVVIGDAAAAPLAVQVHLSSGYGADNVPDVLGVVLDGGIGRMDRLTRTIVSAARAATAGSVLVVVAGTGTWERSSTAASDRAAIAAVEDAIPGDAPAIAAVVPGGMFLDQGVLRAEQVTGQVAVDALREVETTEGERMMADAFQGFAVSFARYC